MLNDLLVSLSLPVDALDPKYLDMALFGKVLRLLRKRCQDDAMVERVRNAVVKFTTNGGMLPEGIELFRNDGVVDTNERGSPETPAMVPRHKCLQMCFRLESSAFMLTYHSDAFTLASWTEFQAHIEELARRFGARAWAACLETSEKSQRSLGDAPVFHTHAYMVWTDGVGLRLRGLDVLAFNSIRPRVDICTARGRTSTPGAPSREALRGLWYVAVMKQGTQFARSNHQAWRDYTPSVAWLTSLWDSNKLSHEQYLHLSMKFRTGHAKRKRDLAEVQKDEYAEALKQHVAEECAAALRRRPLLPLRTFPEIDVYVESFRNAEHRRPILVLLGASNTGKSLLAARVLERVAGVLGLPSFLEVTVEADEALDFSEYDHRRHSGVLLDGIGDAALLWRHRESLQGRPKATRGGRSATMVYSYQFTLAGRAVVATLDQTAARLDWFNTNQWLNKPKNVCVVRLSGPAWQCEAAASGASELAATQADIARAWSVADVATFFRQGDAAGVATTFERNAVNGEDLLSFATAAEICRDLQLTPFAARKVMQLRDAFLTEGELAH